MNSMASSPQLGQHQLCRGGGGDNVQPQTAATRHADRGQHRRSRSQDEPRQPGRGRHDEDEVPQDISAFYGHPLTAATHSKDGEALALLHEYQSMQAIDSVLAEDRLHGFHNHQTTELNSSSSVDSDAFYKTVHDDEDEDDDDDDVNEDNDNDASHVDGARSIDENSYGDYESDPEHDISVVDSCSCGHLNCMKSSPLPATNTFLSEHEVSPISSCLTSGVEQDNEVNHVMGGVDILLSDSCHDDELHSVPFDTYDDNGSHVDEYVSTMSEDDLEENVSGDVIVEYRTSSLNSWNPKLIDDDSSGGGLSATLSRKNCRKIQNDPSSDFYALAAATKSNRKRKLTSPQPPSAKHTKEDKTATVMTELSKDYRQTESSSYSLSSTVPAMKLNNEAGRQSVAGSAINTLVDNSQMQPDFVHFVTTNSSVCGQQDTSESVVYVYSDSSVEAPSVNTGSASGLFADTGNASTTPTVTSCHSRYELPQLSTSPFVATSSSTSNHQCTSCGIPTLSSATINLVNRTMAMTSIGQSAHRQPPLLDAVSHAGQIARCAGVAVSRCGNKHRSDEEAQFSCQQGLFSSSPRVMTSQTMAQQPAPDFLNHQHRPVIDPSMPVVTKQWPPTATVIPMTTPPRLTSPSVHSHQLPAVVGKTASKAKPRKKAVYNLPMLEMGLGRGTFFPPTSSEQSIVGVPGTSIQFGRMGPGTYSVGMTSATTDVRLSDFSVASSSMSSSQSYIQYPLQMSNGSLRPPPPLIVPTNRLRHDSPLPRAATTMPASSSAGAMHSQLQQLLMGTGRNQPRHPETSTFNAHPSSVDFKPVVVTSSYSMSAIPPRSSVSVASNQPCKLPESSQVMAGGDGSGRSNSGGPKLPFPLPPVPPGYRLVITHHSLPSNDSETTTPLLVTQLIIDNPAAGNGQADVASSSATETGVQSRVREDVPKCSGSSPSLPINAALAKKPVRPRPSRPSTLNLKKVRPTLTHGTDHNVQFHFTKVEQDTQASNSADRFTPNSASQRAPAPDVVHRCQQQQLQQHQQLAGIENNEITKFLKTLSAERAAGGSIDDILERSMKATNVWSGHRHNPYQQHSSTPQHLPQHMQAAIKVEQSRSLPSTPTGSAVGANGMPQGQVIGSSVACGRCLPLTSDGSGSAAAATASSSQVSMGMMLMTDRVFDSGATITNDVTGCWGAKPRVVSDRNNNSMISESVNYDPRKNSADLSRYQQNVVMTPGSDDTTSPEDFQQASEPETKPADQDNWQSNTQSTLSKYDAMSSFTRRSHISVIPKIDPDPSGYQFYLDASISTNKRLDEDRLTYLNKGLQTRSLNKRIRGYDIYSLTRGLRTYIGQYYGLVLTRQPQPEEPFTARKCHIVRSVVMVLFRERHSLEEEQKAWQFWHSRQHSFKQRVIDIDSKICGGSVPISIEEIAYNAVAIVWNAQDQFVKVNIAVNCLSTDFSHQKGIKGSPLHLQIDTYADEHSNYLIHRTYAQIKVFCDKGADRKTREEERKIMKMKLQGDPQSSKYQSPCDRTYFYTMADLATPPILFQPHNLISEVGLADSCLIVPSNVVRSTPLSYKPAVLTAHQHQRLRSVNYESVQQPQRVLLYVREENDHVFTALLLDYPTVECLLLAIQEKYNIDHKLIKNVFTRSRKCMLVRVDDNFVRHFANESTFVIRINRTQSARDDNNSSDVTYDVTLIEIDVQNDEATCR